MSRAILAALAVLLLAAAAEARYAPSERSLLQDTTDTPDAATCIAKTHAQCTACRYNRVGGTTMTVCQTCNATNGYKVSTDGQECECLPGYSYDSGAKTCTACGDDYYCTGGTAARVQCPDNLSTPAGLTTAQREDQCVTDAGYGINADNAVVQCPVDTYNEGGNRRPCTPCGRGLKTAATLGHDSPTDCMAPAGSYYDRGTARPCPRGTYTLALNTASACTACNTGVSTAGPGSSLVAACALAKPGYRLTGSSDAKGALAAECGMHTYQDAFTATTTCTGCGTNLETRKAGARSAAACVAPPGYGYTAADGSNPASAAACDGATYKAGYNRKGCVACGDSGFLGTSGNKTSFANCYIPAGSGTTRTGTAFNNWAAAPCPEGSYGASANIYGVRNFPCTACAKGMTTTANNQTSPTACVTKPGYGYDSLSQTAQICGIGYYSAGYSRAECTYCGTGWTTAAEGSTSAVDCVIAPGYGYAAATPTAPETCAFGWYGVGMGNTTACTACDATTWTTKESATSVSDCSVCRAGYGNLASNACTYCDANSFSAGGETACTSCGNDYLGNAAQSPMGSTSNGACLPRWTELEPSLDVINFVIADATVDTAATAALCRTACGADATCMFYAFKATAAAGAQCHLIKDNTAGTSYIAFQNADSYYTVYKFDASRTVGDSVPDSQLSAGTVALRKAAGAEASAALQLQACTAVCDSVSTCVAAVLNTGAAADDKCVLKAARMSEDFFDASHNGCEVQAQGAKMNLVPGATVAWTAPTYVAGQ